MDSRYQEHVNATLYTEDGSQELGNVQPGMDYIGRTTLGRPTASHFRMGYVSLCTISSNSSEFPVTGVYREENILVEDRNDSNDWEPCMLCIIQVV
ncbi:predicted protein [Lichtheimia corymbifera JMRC:FSU:9682]|uniref:Uncharacterized protein n=1 Tax=Lichtheimia corymbifera JMRC:FSU:9682 TaxID=1263082 RepID=A0A068RRB4_9FUNG|nr:predicted protein [Lichtheimia corymbifera JMRC:FSU:9682]